MAQSRPQSGDRRIVTQAEYTPGCSSQSPGLCALAQLKQHMRAMWEASSNETTGEDTVVTGEFLEVLAIRA